MAEAAVADTMDVKKGGGKMKIIIAAVAALAIGAAATWFLVGGKKDAHPEVAVVKEVPSLFYPLETFTVNLVPEFGDQYLQVEMTLKIAGQEKVDEIKARMPEVRNKVILLLSSKRASELTTVPGKSMLADSVRSQINALIDPTAKPKPEPAPLKRVDPNGEAPQAEPGEEHASTPMNEHASEHDRSGPVLEVLFTSFIIQ